MRTPTLFDHVHPMARKSDPVTSHQAARRVRESGRASSNRDRIHACLALHGDAVTAIELLGRMGEDDPIDRHEISRRLPELEREGRVKRGPRRLCRVRGTSMTTWLAT